MSLIEELFNRTTEFKGLGDLAGPCIDVPATVPSRFGPLGVGDVFRIGSDVFRIQYFRPAGTGAATGRPYPATVTVWGGSKDPGGYRAFHDFYFEDVTERARPLRRGEEFRTVPWQILARP
jgi:hypothetical protein